MLGYNTGGRGEFTKRVVEPLGVVFYSRHWHLVVWYRLREGMRDFRLDRMEAWEVPRKTIVGHEDFSLMEFIHAEIDSCQLTPVTLECDSCVLDHFLAELPAQLVSQAPLPNGRV